jgi:hypothetical protein
MSIELERLSLLVPFIPVLYLLRSGAYHKNKGLHSGRLQPCQQILDRDESDWQCKNTLAYRGITYGRKTFYNIGP